MEFSSLHNLENNIRRIEEYDARINPEKYTIKQALKDKDVKGLKKAQKVAKAARLRLKDKTRFITERKLVKVLSTFSKMPMPRWRTPPAWPCSKR